MSEGAAVTGARKLRLVHVVTVPLSLRFLCGQIGYMATRGFEVTVVSSPGDGLDQFCREEVVEACRIEMARRITPARDLAAVWRIYQYFRALRPDLVHAQTPKGGLLGTVAAWLARVPVRVYHIRGLPLMTATGIHRVLLRWTERVACKFADQVLCVSDSVRDVIVGERICRPEKVKVLLRGSGNGVDASHRFNPARSAHRRSGVRRSLGVPEDAIVAGFVGRIVRDKGGVELVASWRHLSTSFPNLHLLVVGDFEPRDPVPADVREVLQSDPRVHFTGWVEDTPALYAAMDLVVLPTYREGFPNVALEAAAMGLPIVATDVPGCRDAIIGGVTGTLVPVRDADALAEGVRQYLTQPALRRAHGLAGRERVLRDYEQETIWEALYGEYVRLLRQNSPWTLAAADQPDIAPGVYRGQFVDMRASALDERP